MVKYIYCEEFKNGRQFRQGFATKAEAFGFANTHFENNPDVVRAYVVQAEDEDPDLSTWVKGVEIKVLKDK